MSKPDTLSRQKMLGTEPIPKLLVKFSIPAIVGMIVQSLYNVADRYFIGQLPGPEGADAIAGVTVGFPFMLVMMAVGMLIGIGGTSVFSIFNGQGKGDEAKKTLGNAVALLVGLGIVLTVLGLLFLEPLLHMFGASTRVLPYASSYMTIVLLGATFNGIGFGINNFIRADGSPKTAMLTMFIGALLNIALDPLFIFGFGWGVAGAAWATIISQSVSALWVLSYFLGKRCHARLSLASMKPDKAIIARIVAIGSAPFAMQLAASMLNVVLNKQLQVFGGDAALTVIGIIYSIALFFFMPIFGINQGASPIIGYNYGAMATQRVRQAALLAIGAASAVVLSGFVLVQLFPRELIGIFNQSKIVLDMGETSAHFFFLMFPLVGFQIVAANYFQAVGKPLEAMFLTLSRQILFLLPLLFIMPQIFGLAGIWYAIPVADGLASLVTGFFFIREMARLKSGVQMGSSVEPVHVSTPAGAVNFADPVNNESDVL